MSKEVPTEPWSQDSRLAKTGMANGNSSSSNCESKTPEERLLETIVPSAGVRLQPTRDAIRVFLGLATKLDMLALSHSLETKLQSPQWQAGVCVLCIGYNITTCIAHEHILNTFPYCLCYTF